MNRDWLKVALVSLLALWVTWSFIGFFLILGEKDGRAGLFGDFFGGLNALISIFGFIAIIHTILKSQEDGEEDRQRHTQNLNLQSEILEAQRTAAICQERHARIANVSSNIDIHSTIYRNALIDKYENQKFIHNYGEILLKMKNDDRNIIMFDWLDSRMTKQQMDDFGFACARVRNALNFKTKACIEAGNILDDWNALAASIKKEAQIAQGFKSYYMRQLLELGDPETLKTILNNYK